MRRSLSSCTWDERRAGRMKRSSFEKRFTSPSISGRRVPDESCVNSFVGADRPGVPCLVNSDSETHSPRLAAGATFSGKACSLEAGWRWGGLWKCFSTTDHTRRCPRGRCEFGKGERCLRPAHDACRTDRGSGQCVHLRDDGRDCPAGSELHAPSSRFMQTLVSLSNCRTSRGSGDALAQFSCHSADPARDHLADLPEPEHRARNRGTEYPVAWAQAHRAKCPLKNRNSSSVTFKPQAADGIDDGDAALTAFDTMQSGGMAAYRDHPRRKWR